MSIVAVVDVAISVKTFINIELHSQGWYALRFCLPIGADVRAVWPTVVLEPEIGHERQPPSQAWTIEPGGYRTRMFRIRFCYEEVDVSETFILQLYLNGMQNLENLGCTLEVELLFSESDGNNTKPPPSHQDLKPVAKETLRISRVVTGAHEHYSCTFDAEHFGLANIAIITLLQGFTTYDALESSSALKHSSSGRGRKSLSSPRLAHPHTHGGGGGAAAHPPSYSPSVGALNTLSDSPAVTPRSAPGPAGSSGNGAAPAQPSVSGSGSLLQREQSAPAVSGSGAPPWAHSVSMTEDYSVNGGGVGGAPALGVGVGPALSAALQVAVATAIAPPVVGGSSSKCGPSSSSRPPVSLLCLEQTLTPAASKALETLYQGLVGCQHRSVKRMANFLKALPKSCYAPQNYETVRTLLQGLPTSPHKPSVQGAGAFNSILQHNAPLPGAPDSTFLKSLPANCTIAMALEHLEAQLTRLRREALAEWTVVMWVLRACPLDMHRYLKCNWELEQPRLIENWLSINMCMSDVEAELALTAGKRARWRQECPFEVPQVHNGQFWDLAATHPILLIDDSMATHRPSTSEPEAPASATPPSPNSPTPIITGTTMPSNRKDRTETHFVIFVHGFQGNSADLCLVKGHLSMIYPYLECYSSRVNENNTSDSIQEMGARLAKEVADLVKPYVSASRRPFSALSFVGHSIGNLILRSALTHPDLAPYLGLLHMYVSICGPHLGFMYSTNAMLDAGVSVLKSMSSKGKCLHQLSFSDASKLPDCYLYKLAHQSALADFKYLILVSSIQDRYVPYHSSRISMCPAANKDTKRGAAYKAMAAQLLKGVGDPGRAQLLRIDVDFDFKSKGFSLSNMINNKIGRQAHIEFIESNVYARFLAWTIHKYHILKEVDHTWL